MTKEIDRYILIEERKLLLDKRVKYAPLYHCVSNTMTCLFGAAIVSSSVSGDHDMSQVVSEKMSCPITRNILLLILENI